jgi:3-dehydroquinate dehydratase II
MTTIAIINGPNLNLLGQREPHHYGSLSLDAINEELFKSFKNKATLNFFQSNHEGEIIDHVQGLDTIDGIVINPGAFTHTSIAIRDALLAKNVPVVEVHLSNIYRRETFRQVSYFSDIAVGVISGLGHVGYRFAVEALLGQKNVGS